MATKKKNQTVSILKEMSKSKAPTKSKVEEEQKKLKNKQTVSVLKEMMSSKAPTQSRVEEERTRLQNARADALLKNDSSKTATQEKKKRESILPEGSIFSGYRTKKLEQGMKTSEDRQKELLAKSVSASEQRKEQRATREYNKEHPYNLTGELGVVKSPKSKTQLDNGGKWDDEQRSEQKRIREYEKEKAEDEAVKTEIRRSVNDKAKLDNGGRWADEQRNEQLTRRNQERAAEEQRKKDELAENGYYTTGGLSFINKQGKFQDLDTSLGGTISAEEARKERQAYRADELLKSNNARKAAQVGADAQREEQLGLRRQDAAVKAAERERFNNPNVDNSTGTGSRWAKPVWGDEEPEEVKPAADSGEIGRWRTQEGIPQNEDLRKKGNAGYKGYDQMVNSWQNIAGIAEYKRDPEKWLREYSAMTGIPIEELRIYKEQGEWINRKPESPGHASIKYTTELAEWTKEGRDKGYFDGGDDMSLWSREKLEAEHDRLEKEKEARDASGVTRQAEKEELWAKHNVAASYGLVIEDLKENGIRGGEYGEKIYYSRPENEEERAEMDQKLFDWVYGDGEYEKLINGNEEEKQQAQDEAVRLWDVIEGKTEDTMAGRMEEESSRLKDEYKQVGDSIDEELQKINKELYLRELEDKAINLEGYGEDYEKEDWAHSSGVVKFLTLGAVNTASEYDDMIYLVNHPFAERVANIIGEGKSSMALGLGYDSPDAQMFIQDLKDADFLTEEERNQINVYAKAGMKQEAMAVYQGLLPSLRERRAFYESESYKGAAEQFGGARGVFNDIVSVFSKPGNAVNDLWTMAKAALGDPEAADRNSKQWNYQRWLNTTRQARAEAWSQTLGESGKDIHSTVMSGADSAWSMYLGKMIGAGAGTEKVTKFITEGLMSMEAATGTMYNELESKSPQEAAFLAIGSGIIEWATENYSLEVILDPKAKDMIKGGVKGVARYLAESGMAEASEEIVGYMMETMYEDLSAHIFNHKNEIQTNIDAAKEEIKASKPWLSEEDIQLMAEKQVFSDMMIEMCKEGASAFFSSLGMTGTQVGSVKISQAKQNNLLNKATASTLTTAARQGEILDAAAGMNLKAKDAKQLKLLTGEFKTNGELSESSRLKLAKIVNSNDSDVAHAIATLEAKDIIKDRAKEKIQQNNARVDEKTLDDAAKGAAKIVLGNEEDLTKEERAAMTEVGQVVDVVEEIQEENRQDSQRDEKTEEQPETFMEQLESRLKKRDEGVFAVRRKFNEYMIKDSVAQRVNEAWLAGAETATDEEIEAAINNGSERIDSPNEVIADGEITEIQEIKDGKVVTKNGKALDPWNVKATNRETAAVLQSMQQDLHVETDENGEIISQKEATENRQREAQQAEAVKNAQENPYGTNPETALENAQNRRVDSLLTGKKIQTGFLESSQESTEKTNYSANGQNTGITSGNKPVYMLGSDRFYNELLKAAQNSNSKNGHVAYEGIRLRMYAMFGMEKPKTRLSDESANDIWQVSQEDYAEAEEARLKDPRSVKPGEGVTTFNGTEYGTDAFNKEVQKVIPKDRQMYATSLAKVAKAAGINLNLIYDEKNNGLWGSESQSGIMINLAGTNDAEGTNHHNPFVSFAHEILHMIENSSPQAYQDMRRYVMQSLMEDMGEYDLMQYIEKKIYSRTKSGDYLDLNGTIAEIVADSFDQILGNQEAVDALERKNPSLYKKVQTAVKSLYTKIKNALKSLRGSISEEAVHFLNDRAEKMKDLFIKGWEETVTGERSGERRKKAEGAGTSEQMSIRETADGKKYVNIDTEQKIFDEADPADYPRIVARYITDRYRGTVIGTNNRAYVDRRAANEYARPAAHGITQDIYNTKARLSTELNNLMDAAEFEAHEDDDGRHEEAVGGWDNYKATIYSPYLDKYFEGTIRIEKVAKGDRFHDFTKIKDVTSAMKSRNALPASGNISNKNITQKETNSKTQQSIRESDAAYMQAVENGDMETAQRMVDEAAEKAGNTIRGDHGTVSKYFTIFDREKGNPEGDWGRGFYFSSNITDANRNYASEFGPDVQAKIERLADNLDWMDGYEGLSYEERYDIAKKMIVQDNPRIITAAIRMQNPVVIGGENETFFDYTEEYDEETEEYGEPEGPFVDLMDALEYAAGEYEYARVDFSDLWAYATDYQGMDARTFEKLAKEAVGDIEDEEGNLVGNEIVRDAFERAGYDGIVDNTVAWKFGSRSGRGAGMVGVNEGTTHYIAFDSAQIKQTDPVTYDDNGNVIPLSERFNPNNKDIRYSLAERDVREYLAKWADQHVRENNDNKAEILKKYGIKMSDLTTGPVLYENQWARYGISKADQEKLAMLDRDTAKWEEKRMDAMGLDENDLGAQYVSAWKYNDVARMEQILMEKMSGIDGIIPYKAPHWYDTAQHRQIANLIKEGNPEAITIAAVEMANLVPKNAVLIPMPPRSGKVTASTDTMLLANRISELTGRPVLNALEGAERMSRKEAKDNNVKMTAEDLGFRLVKDIPDGMIPYFVDNVVGSGVTAQAAHDAAGGGITLAYAKSTRAGIEGLKNASPTFSDKYHMYLIPLDARMDMTKSGPKGAQYSLRTTEDGTIVDNDGNAVAEILPGGVVTAYSIRTVDNTVNEALIDELVKQGFSRKQVKKWVDDVFGIAAMIAADRDRLDFKAYGQNFLKNNQEYIKTLDGSTLCAKRLLYQGIFNQIQHMLPNTPLLPADLLKLTNKMKQKGMVTPCSLCYVESRRRLLGKFASEWLKQYDGAYKPRIEELTTTDGLQALRDSEDEAKRQAAADFEEAMARKGSANPKLVQMRTEYNGEIRELSNKQITKIKEIGGLRVQSFSDFEIVHMLDLMQAVMDMAAMDLTSQAYTKVPEMAWVFGDTGIKINLSLIGEGTGLDENGKLKFSSVEGMDYETALAIRQRYGKNVGTILVGMNDDHIIAAMGDDTIDFIIPFHKSGWSKREMALMIGMGSYKDFTRWQNEKKIDYVGKDGKIKTIPAKKSKISNFQPVGPNGYWNFSKDGTWNAEKYLKMCAKDGRVPKFSQFLVNNGDGSFSLPQDDSERSRNIRKGYWKLLIDFKMYDNEGKGAPQQTVKPNFNMDEARKILENYEGGADELPGNMNFAQEYVEEYKKEHPRKQYAMRDESGIDINNWMLTVQEASLTTEQEKALLRDYKDLRMKADVQRDKIRNYSKQIDTLEAMESLPKEERSRLQGLKVKLANAQTVLAETEKKLAEVMGREGYANLMYRQKRIMDDITLGRSTEDIEKLIDEFMTTAKEMRAQLQESEKRLKDLAQTEAVRMLRSYESTARMDKLVSHIASLYSSSMNRQQMKDELLKIALKIADGQDVQADVENFANMLLDTMKGEGSGLFGRLRGTVIRLSASQMKELLGTDSSIKELRNEFAGTGIKVVQAKEGERASSNLDAGTWQEICDVVPGLDRTATDLDQIRELRKAVQAEKRAINSAGQEWSKFLPNIMADVLNYASQIASDFQTDEKSKAQIKRMMNFIGELAGETQVAADKMAEMDKTLEEMTKRGKSVDQRVNTLRFDMQTAVDYLNETAKQAILREKEKRQCAIVEQLKSDQAQELMRVNQQWRDMMERDRNARKIAEENAGKRNQVDKLATRIMKYLSRPDAQKFVPEHMQGMARAMLQMIVDNDLGGRHLTEWEAKALLETKRVLEAWTARDGEPDIYEAAQAMDPNNDMGMIDYVNDLFLQLGEGLEKYNGYRKGQTKLEALKARNEALKQIQDAFTQLYNMIHGEMNIAIGDRKVAVMDAAMKIYAASQGSKFKGERRGFGSKQRNALHKFIISGNLTPEYFFKMLKNYGLDEIWEEYHRAENRNGLLLKEAKDRLAEIAEKHGFKSWDMDQKFTLQLDKGGTVQMTLGQMMSLMATWNREKTLGPEMSQHLEYGGFVLEDKEQQKGKARREKISNKPHRVTEADMTRIGALLSDEQKAFVDDVVEYLSNNMSKIGNEASMRAFGIKKYKETYYFPFKSWNGNLNQRSDQTGNVNNDSRLMHQGFTKLRLNKARNALLISDFMDVAVNHIVGMVNYATMGVANENLQKVLNARMEENGQEGEYDYDNIVKRNIKAILEEAYGKEAADYLDELKTQMNGGAVARERGFGDKMISLFRKNAVAGSLSVAAQQPLSYIRAAIMINPKYLAQALNPKYWRGSYEEMMKYSGVAVIKDMGRFDMNAGQSAKEYLKPDAKTGKVKAAYEWIGDKATILPELMDRMTWTRMWSAVKMEQAAQHPDMDIKSDEFLKIVADRFNDVMRKTQVYDSTLVKSANMRSQNHWVKGLTSFMAEPTLTLNVLADAVQNTKEPGGKLKLAKAAAVFLMSAIAQAAIKAGFSTGRSPNKKKTWEENFLQRFLTYFLSEANPLTLFPGYSDLITLLKTGELQDDAMGALGKLFQALRTGYNLATGEQKNGTYRDIEDSVGQILQLITNVPAKNIMRDARAMYNWFNPGTYADRPTDPAVIKYQSIESIFDADNMIGVVNDLLGDAGYKMNNAAYYKRLYNAKKNGNEQEEKDLISFLLNGRTVKQTTIDSQVKSLTKADEELTAEEKVDFMMDEGYDPDSYITDQVKTGELDAEAAYRMLKESNPDADENSLWWKVDRASYFAETGESAGSGYYYRLKDAMRENSSEKIKNVVGKLLNHGRTNKQIQDWITNDSGFKKMYLEANGNEKIKIKNCLIMAYKAAGMSEEEANNKINKWK